MGSVRKTKTVHYFNAEGKRCRSTDPWVRKEHVLSKKWYGEWVDANGIAHHEALSEDKKLAKEILATKIADSLRARYQFTPDYNAQLARPLIEHLADFRASIVARGRTTRHAADQASWASDVLQVAGVTYWNQLTGGAIERALGRIRSERKVSLSRLNHLLTAVKQFSRWMAGAEEKRAPHDPLVNLKRFNEKVDVRYHRRALELPEWRKLLDATLKSRVKVKCLRGKDRAALYLTAVSTGWRVGALRQLTVGDFRLDSQPPHAKLGAHAAKGKKESVKVLPGPVAGMLREYFKDRPKDQLAWPGKDWPNKAARMLRHDMGVAGIPHRTERGVFDFHALRNSAITWLFDRGTSPDLIQLFAGHSTLTLTVRYARPKVSEVDKAVAALPLVRGLFVDDSTQLLQRRTTKVKVTKPPKRRKS